MRQSSRFNAEKLEHTSASMIYNCMTFILPSCEVRHACYRQYTER
ncbi:hypothetical protein VO64_1451 [Pseudomonas synxantha]|uniref:Uncharacterized protein n=1 Tax=Pseudomonas synxantha TaxID=47883 RepID=A0AAU8TVK9_9PSED|nr:hypothetical protein VO64_1451 [Pseudomonas synxantha]